MIKRTLFDNEHDMFRDMVRRYIAEKIMPDYRSWEAAGQVPREAWLQAGEMGILCTSIGEAYGGVGGDFRYGAIVIEEMARAGATAPTFYLQSEIISPYLANHGTEEQKNRWLPDMVSGRAVAAVAMSEPSGGSDLQNIKTSAIRDGDEYVINGQKVFITNGITADLIVLACKTDPSLGAKGVSLVLVETDRAGLTRGKPLEKIGSKAQDTAELFFNDVRVPVGNLLGKEGGGFYILMAELPQERLVQAIRAVAACEAAIEWTIAYARERKLFGKTLAEFQNTQFTLAALHAETLGQRVFVDRCIELHLNGALDAVDAAAAKLITTELQGKVMDQCLQLFGGWGYMTEYPIARAFVDARLTRIGGGSIEVMKQIIGRSLLPR
jgi:acyl-CoA dehydrogenase